MSLINCEINLILTWSDDCDISSANGATKFKIKDTKLYVPVLTLSTQDSEKLSEQLKPRFKRTINWNKYQSNVSSERQNQYLDFLVDPSFQGVNRILFYRLKMRMIEQYTQNLPKVEIKDYNVMIDGKSIF